MFEKSKEDGYGMITVLKDRDDDDDDLDKT